MVHGAISGLPLFYSTALSVCVCPRTDVNKPWSRRRRRRRGGGFYLFIYFYSQHSGARRADEAAHRDVGVSHPGLVTLEAVFVYSRLGQLPDLAGADLLVVPVLSVRHFIPCPPPPRCLS